MARAAKPYRYLDHTADLGIEVWAKDLGGLFSHIGQAIFETQIIGKIRMEKEKTIVLKGESLEDLFVDWCRELLYNFSVESYIPAQYKIEIENLSLQAHLLGDLYDPNRHRVRMEIKNPTYHNLAIEKKEGIIRARIIFDV
jgi:SHS2 domain-containing protein